MVVAEMDGEANEVAGIRVRRFPTLLLFDASSGGGGGTVAPKEYRGKHSVEGMMAFIKKHIAAPSVIAGASAVAESTNGGGGGVDGGSGCADGDNECKSNSIPTLAQDGPLP